jgi:lipid II:glycine glycyltransferase (peptidoglycan interpeptide bridge formation enzyme)
MRLVVTDRVDREQWDDFVTQHPLGTVYHFSAWQDVIKKTYGYQALYHLLVDDNSNLQAAISSLLVKSRLTGNRIISYPFSDNCDPLVGNSEELDVLLGAIKKSKAESNANFIEVRFGRAHEFINNFHVSREYFNHLLPLDRTPEELFQSFHKSCIQRGIKKALKQRLEIITGENEHDLKAFYRLHIMTRKKHGVPIQPFRFFKNLWNVLAPRDMLTLLLARHQDRFIASIIVLWFKGMGHYKYGASDDGFLHLRANQLLLWEAIRQAQEKGCSCFDLGRASVANKELNQYKGRWGTIKAPLYYLRAPQGQKVGALMESSKEHAFVKGMMKRMPVPLIRMSGELFYKHFA